MFNLSHLKKRVIHLKFSAPTEPSDFHNLMSFLKDELPNIGPIVLILDTDGQGGFEPEHKRELSLWFKANKQVLKENLFSLIRICSHVSVFTRISSKAFSAAMPCPYQVEDSLANATLLAEKILIKKGFNND